MLIKFWERDTNDNNSNDSTTDIIMIDDKIFVA